jgi:N-acetylglucosaminyldiphosphoundecaprenol N-acetyl-beta-D-mannosaminyltransferase
MLINAMPENVITSPVRETILGLPLHMTNLDEASALAESWVRSGRKTYTCHVDARLVLAARASPHLHAVLAGADLCCTDGMPLVWLAKMRGHAVGRVYGPDFMQALWTRTARWSDRPCRHFFFGATTEILTALKERLLADHPGNEVVGMLAPPMGQWGPDAAQLYRETINAAAPDVLWVSLGAPRQELWVVENRPFLAVPLIVPVGAAFSFLSGDVAQAPLWLRQAGFEWLFRLFTEPRRLAKRYLTTVPRFLALAAKEEFLRRIGKM